MAVPGYKREEKTGILSNIRDKANTVFNWNKKTRDAGNKWVRDQSNQYRKQASDAFNSYESYVQNNKPYVQNNKSHKPFLNNVQNNKSHNTFLKKIFGEDNKFLKKIDKVDKKLDQAAYMVQDAAGTQYNDIGIEGLNVGLDVLQNIYGLAKDGAGLFNQRVLGIDGPLAKVEGVGKATWTAYQNLAGGFAEKYLPEVVSDWLGPPTDMRKDAMLAQYNYSPFSTMKDGSQPGKNFYDSYINSSEFNTQANKDRIKIMTDRDMESYTPEIAFKEYQQYMNSDQFKTDISVYTPEEQTAILSDRKKLFNNFYDIQVANNIEAFNAKNEWRIASPGYSKLASEDYRNEMQSKYGKYDLTENLNPRIDSPYEDISANLNLANPDYMKRYKAVGGFGNDATYDIPYPTEFDYGFMDRSPVEGGPGLTKERFLEPIMYKYKTPEAETFGNNLINITPSLLLGGGKGGRKLLRGMNKGFQAAQGSKTLREILPGLLQWGNNDFGFRKYDSKFGNFLAQTINKTRRRGGQFAGTALAIDELKGD